MNTSFFLNMKSIFFNSGKIFFSKYKSTMKPAVTGLIIFAFTTVFIFSCNGNDNDTTKKTDPATQQNNQSGEGEGMDRNHGGMGDSNHRGKGHAPNGMDTTHRKNHE